MPSSLDTYAPGWGSEIAKMISARTAGDRAAFLLPLLRRGMRVLDVGCGPGSITLGLARAVGPEGQVLGVDLEPTQIETARTAATSAGIPNLRFEVANATSLPVPTGSIDVVFAHALFEHLSAPGVVLGEMRRVLRPGGTLAICSSDWLGARLDPDSADVRLALQAHLDLRRRAGGDPFAGGKLAERVLSAGFSEVRSGVENKIDMAYSDLGSYVASRIREGITRWGCDDVLSEEALAAADRWAAYAGPGVAFQRWVHVLARS